ncbi:hypothetical protein PIB30_086994 [Stylosanthes scabra]|uniref:Uncharacterized protein n=1 Tax=Stylosanthes scabra TaxID=79078 RepID=A0ABU6STZ9_9FABA|nr:hypothetical protein [Stylosanthes scabra]
MWRLISGILVVLGLTVAIRLPSLSLWLLRWDPTSRLTIAPSLSVILHAVGQNCSDIIEVCSNIYQGLSQNSRIKRCNLIHALTGGPSVKMLVSIGRSFNQFPRFSGVLFIKAPPLEASIIALSVGVSPSQK